MTGADMRHLGAVVMHALVVVDREESAREALKSQGIELISLLTRADF